MGNVSFTESLLLCRLEVIQRLAHITPAELGGKAHPSQDTDNKLDQWLMYAMFACSCPPDSREGGGSAATKELFHLIFPSLKSGSDAHIVSAWYLITSLRFNIGCFFINASYRVVLVIQ